MSEERFREIFRRITSETPDAPAFSDLDVPQAGPGLKPWIKPWVALAGAASVVLFVVGGIGLLGGGGANLASPSISTTTEPSPIPDDCPVTIPDGTFTPPEGYPTEPTSPGGRWYGTNGLWTVLPSDGVYTPREGVWWSVDFPGGEDEEEPQLSVTFELFRSSESPEYWKITNERATKAFTEEDGWFMIAGVDPEMRGCWRVTAVYKGGSLSYVYYNPYFDDPAVSVPDVVGLTVSEARAALSAAGYSISVSLGVEEAFQVCNQDPVGGTSRTDRMNHVKLFAEPPGECNKIPDEVNTDYLTYLDQFGRAWYATSCPSADVLISGGAEAADGLPNLGQTSPDRVGALVADFGADFVGRNNAVAAKAVVRNGDVWDRDDGGNVVVEQVADSMVQLTLADDAPCPLAPASWNGVPVAYVRASGPGGLCPDEPPLASSQVMVFFDCGSGSEPNPIGFARPLHPDAPDRITSVFWHLLVGPTVNERARGSGSFYTDVSLVSAELVGDHLIVDLNFTVDLNSGSASTGALSLLSVLTSNAFSVDEVSSVEFRINGSCEGFWAFLQAGDDVCNVIDRP